MRKIFAENYNMTPIQYVNFVRISHACKILQKEAISITDVARRVGSIICPLLLRILKENYRKNS